MGIISGFVRKAQDNSYAYLDLDGVSHTVSADDPAFLTYERAVEFASRFITSLKRFGFGPAIRHADAARSDAEFRDAAAELHSALQRYAAIYESGRP